MQGLIEFLPTIRRIHHGHGVLAQALRSELAALRVQKPLVLLARALRGTEVEAILHDAVGDREPQPGATDRFTFLHG